MDITTFASVLGWRLAGREVVEGLTIKHLLTDSRKLVYPNTTCFFALPGHRVDGHSFIPDLVEQGVKCFVVKDPRWQEEYKHLCVIVVEDVLLALQQIAAWHKAQHTLPTIGITGSNGKTTVKEWLFTMLHDAYNVVKSPGSYNSQIGVPLSVWKLQKDHNLALFEAGISRKGEMDHLASIIQCDMGIFTSLGSAHDAGFESRAEKVLEKIKLFTQAEVVFYPSDDAIVREVLQSNFPTSRLRSWGSDLSSNPDLWISSVETMPHGQSVIHCQYQGASMVFMAPFVEQKDIHNVLTCILVMLHLGWNASDINEKLRRLHHLALRLELLQGVRDTILINDSYSSDPESFQAAVSFLDQHKGGRSKVLVLSGFQDLAEDALSDVMEDLGHRIHRQRPDLVIGIGREIESWLPVWEAQFGIRNYFFSDTDALIREIDNLPIDHAAILFKAARVYHLEAAVNHLMLQSHGAVLEINLAALRNNIRQYIRPLKQHIGVIAMLKAYGYGSGDVELARFMEDNGIDRIAVALLDEAIGLRKAGIQMPILVLNPDPAYLSMIPHYDLEPEIYSLSILQTLIYTLDENKKINIHIKLDTGMHRLGFMPDELPLLIAQLKSHPHIQVLSIFTHLASAEDPSSDAFTLAQLERFEFMYQQLVDDLGYAPARHALNSAGIRRFASFQMDCVRLGIGMYGVSEGEVGYEPVHRLRAKIIQIKSVAVGESVGYNREWIAQRLSRIGVVNIGYADGLMRRAATGGFKVLIKGGQAPIIGKVCMDLCMVDLTDIPSIQEGEHVVFFGPEYPIHHLCAACQTIPYEILSRMSGRVKRIYLEE